MPFFDKVRSKVVPLWDNEMLPSFRKPTTVSTLGVVGLLLVAGVTSWCGAGVAFLQPNEQLVLKHLSGIETRNGPGATVYVPFLTTATKRLGTKLDDLSYVVVKNELTGLEFTVAGPQLYFLNPHEVAGERKRKIVLEKHEYVRLLDAKSGQQRLVKGPAKVVPDPFESIVNERQESAVRLSKLQYVVVTDSLTGNQRVVAGPQLLFPGTYENVGKPRQAYEVQRYQYIKLLDQTRGQLRVERGEATVFPREHEVAAEGGVKDAVNVDDETAVLVLSKASGQQRLVTTKGLFFPEALEEIVEVRKLVRVQPHEVAIVRDNLGAFHFHSGNASGTGGEQSPRCIAHPCLRSQGCPISSSPHPIPPPGLAQSARPSSCRLTASS